MNIWQYTTTTAIKCQYITMSILQWMNDNELCECMHKDEYINQWMHDNEYMAMNARGLK